jgi:hypothetical protein
MSALSRILIVPFSSTPRTQVHARRVHARRAYASTLALILALIAAGAATAQEEPTIKPPVQVTIRDEKPVNTEVVMPIDPAQHVQLQMAGNMLVMVRVDNMNLHLGYLQTVFQIDGNIVYPGNPPGRMTAFNQPLPKTKDGKARVGGVSIYETGKLKITQEIEVVPTKSKPGEKRRLDAAMVRYIVDNLDDQPHKVGMRVQMNTFIGNNRGCLFAAPNQPGKILDGVELKGDKLPVPDYLQILQRNDLKDPGFVAHLTCNFGSSWERPERLALTRQLIFVNNQWDVQIMPAMGISALVWYWDAKEVKQHGQRKCAYAFGQGVASRPEGDGVMAVGLTGSFEPGKLFTIAAQVADPATGQSLTLDLPPGMERVEGKECQPVPAVDEDGNTQVLWKARVIQPGEYRLRIHSSTGVTQTKIITITRPGEKSAGR